MVTITDVAREAGVSKTTVSYVISRNPRISEETAKRVRGAMAKLGYVVNHSARALSTSKTMTLGLQVNAAENKRVSLTRGAYLCELADFARQNGYDLLLMSNRNGVEGIRDMASAGKVDGLILMDVTCEDPRVDAAIEAGIPTVLLGLPDDPKGLDEVDTDFERAARELISLFKRKGHREIALVHTPEGSLGKGANFAVRFRRSVMDEAEAMGITLHVPPRQDWNMPPAEKLRDVLTRYPDISGVIIDDDNTIISTPQVLLALGVSVPDDLSVAVVVPDVLREQMHIPYAAIDINLPAVAQEAVEMMVRRIEHADAPSVTRLVGQPLTDLGSVKTL